jgi:hypothetical protein
MTSLFKIRYIILFPIKVDIYHPVDIDDRHYLSAVLKFIEGGKIKHRIFFLNKILDLYLKQDDIPDLK